MILFLLLYRHTTIYIHHTFILNTHNTLYMFILICPHNPSLCSDAFKLISFNKMFLENQTHTHTHTYTWLDQYITNLRTFSIVFFFCSFFFFVLPSRFYSMCGIENGANIMYYLTLARVNEKCNFSFCF